MVMLSLTDSTKPNTNCSLFDLHPFSDMLSATNMLSSQETDYDAKVVNEEPVFTILDHEFEVDELWDIANYGMRQGVSGFIYH